MKPTILLIDMLILTLLLYFSDLIVVINNNSHFKTSSVAWKLEEKFFCEKNFTCSQYHIRMAGPAIPWLFD